MFALRVVRDLSQVEKTRPGNSLLRNVPRKQKAHPGGMGLRAGRRVLEPMRGRHQNFFLDASLEEADKTSQAGKRWNCTEIRDLFSINYRASREAVRCRLPVGPSPRL